QADGSYKITFTEPLAEDDVVTTVIKGLIPAETPADGDDQIGGDGYDPGTSDPDGDGDKPANDNTVENPDDNAIYNGDINTVIKITSDDPSGEFRPGSGVTYTATSTVTDGPVKDAVVIIGEDPDAPFTDEAPVLKKKAADGTETDLVEGTDYTAEKQADGSYKITFTEPLAEDDVVTTVIKGLIPAETPADGDDQIGGDGYDPGTSDPDGDGDKPANDNTVENPDDNAIYNGDINTVIKITSDEPDGVFRKGSGVTYTATSTVTDGPVKDAVV
ncbi:hypothetical protein, partial [Corynebacterium spheniscorum]|uniref:hypothetical protein n=1 Tax=Corynebacterium spheniscorum TaxID=185761 RepID=UPI0037C1819A